MNEIMGDISRASEEQRAGVAQIGQAVTQMAHTTQQNAALVEESAAAADKLRQQAGELLQAVAVFRLAGHAGTAQAPAAVARPAAKPSLQAAPAHAPKARALTIAKATAAAGSNDDWAQF